ncbi:MAG: apolipoprotein N-acyltransferase [Pseudomonadota bacterium]
MAAPSDPDPEPMVQSEDNLTGGRRWLRLPAAVAAGLAAGLGHVPFGLWPIALFGFGALIFLTIGARRPFWIAWAGGLGYFGLTLHWIVEPFLVDIERHGWMAPFALAFLAGGLALFWGGAAALAARIAGSRALMLALALAGAEAVRGHIFTGFPWALPAYIWVDTPVRLAVSWIGSYGLSLLTLLAVALPFAFGSNWPGRLAGAVLGLGLLAAALYPARVAPPLEAGGDTARIIQPDIAQADKWDPDLAPGHFQRMLLLTRFLTSTGPQPAMVVWPEVAIVQPLDLAGPTLETVSATIGDVPFVTGVNRREDGQWFNSMLVVGAGGQVTETFDKVHLVPFGEYIPFKLAFLRTLAGTSGNGFSSGRDVRLIETPLGRALPLICYEGIFPGHIFRAGERADYLMLLTNDAWFGTFAGPGQHLVQARFRAAEHRLPLLRVANRGVSAAIDAHGNLDPAQTLEMGQPGVADVTLATAPGVSPYAKLGDWPVFGLIGVLLGAGVWARRRKS